MNPQQAEAKVTVEVPLTLVGELMLTTLRRLGWRDIFVNEKLRQATASDRKTERIAHDVWHFEFDTIIRWRKALDAVEIAITVSEKQMRWTGKQCFERCQQILNGIVDDANQLQVAESEHKPSDIYGSAKWATPEELFKSGYIDKKREQRRFVLGPSKEGLISVPAPEAAMHALICGPTGCGKSSTVFIPNLIERTGVSAIVTEATAGDEPPDLFYKTAGFRKVAGHKIYKFNPDDLTSHRINPLDHVQTFDQAAQIASLIIQNTSARYSFGDQIWENSERHLLTILLMHAVAEEVHLGTVRRWLRRGPDGLREILKDSPVLEVQEEYYGFYSSSTEGFRNGVVSGLMQRLNLWVNPKIVALTRATDIDLDALPEELFTFYLAVPAQKVHLKPLSALIFNFILNLVLERKFKYPFALFLDEFTNYGYVPGIAEKLTIIRHRNIPAALGIQDYVQLKKVYGEEDAGLLFSQPGTKLFFRPREINTAKKISESLGVRTITDRKVTSSGHIQEKEMGRPLMNPGEVMAIEKGRVIAFTPSTSPIKLKSFNWQDYAPATQYEAPRFRKLKIDEQLIKDCEKAKSRPDWQRQEPSAKDPKKTNGRARTHSNRDRHKQTTIEIERNRSLEDELEKAPEY